MRILYFAWIRELVGRAEEEIARPARVENVAGLLDWLETRGEGYGEALANRASLRVAVNQEYAGPETPLGDNDEIAIFPPVTGG